MDVSISFGAAEDARALVHLDGATDDDVSQQHLSRSQMKVAVDAGAPQLQDFFGGWFGCGNIQLRLRLAVKGRIDGWRMNSLKTASAGDMNGFFRRRSAEKLAALSHHDLAFSMKPAKHATFFGEKNIILAEYGAERVSPAAIEHAARVNILGESQVVRQG